MKENSIIKLENEEKYIILDKIFFEEEIYYFCSKTGIKNKTMQEKVKFLKEKKEGNDFYLAEIKDKELLGNLIRIIRNIS